MKQGRSVGADRKGRGGRVDGGGTAVRQQPPPSSEGVHAHSSSTVTLAPPVLPPVRQMSKRQQQEGEGDSFRNLWILKPAAFSNRGIGIELATDLQVRDTDCPFCTHRECCVMVQDTALA